ncbi:hypothetical protein LTR95_017382 [Oleoguttula sp. CCFEE 5521]
MGSASDHTLEALPEEVLNSIIEPLELDDIRNIRLSSRTLVAKVVQGRYKAYFYRKASGLGFLVRDLRLEGVMNDMDTWSLQDIGCRTSLQPESKAVGHTASLHEALNNIRSVRGAHALRSVTLHIADLRSEKSGHGYLDEFIINQNRWRPIGLRAVTSFDLVVSSLAGSGLLVEQLHLFNDFVKGRCSLTSNTLDAVAWRGENASVFKGPKSTSVSLSDLEVPDSFDGLRKLLLSAPLLEVLDLHQFSIGPRNLPRTRFTPRDRVLGISPTWDVPPDAEHNLL